MNDKPKPVIQINAAKKIKVQYRPQTMLYESSTGFPRGSNLGLNFLINSIEIGAAASTRTVKDDTKLNR